MSLILEVLTFMSFAQRLVGRATRLLWIEGDDPHYRNVSLFLITDRALYGNISFISFSLFLTHLVTSTHHYKDDTRHIAMSLAPADLSVSSRGLCRWGCHVVISPVAFSSLFWLHRRHFHKKRPESPQRRRPPLKAFASCSKFGLAICPLKSLQTGLSPTDPDASGIQEITGVCERGRGNVGWRWLHISLESLAY